MNYRSGLLDNIHHWDVLTFRRFMASSMRTSLVEMAKTLSRSGNGHLYPLVPLVVAATGLVPPLEFLRLALIAYAIERSIYFIAKNAFKRRRPANILPNYRSEIIASDEFSFPSGHSSAAFLMVTLLVLTFGPALMVLYLWSAMVAASRVILGVHFPTDTMVGGLLGSAIAYLACLI